MWYTCDSCMNPNNSLSRIKETMCTVICTFNMELNHFLKWKLCWQANCHDSWCSLGEHSQINMYLLCKILVFVVSWFKVLSTLKDITIVWLPCHVWSMPCGRLLCRTLGASLALEKIVEMLHSYLVVVICCILRVVEKLMRVCQKK